MKGETCYQGCIRHFLEKELHLSTAPQALINSIDRRLFLVREGPLEASEMEEAERTLASASVPAFEARTRPAYQCVEERKQPGQRPSNTNSMHLKNENTNMLW